MYGTSAVRCGQRPALRRANPAPLASSPPGPDAHSARRARRIARAGNRRRPRRLAGQKHIRPYWKNYYQNTDGIVYMIDSTDKRRFDEAAEELAHLLDEPSLSGAPVLVFANKQDLLNAAPPSEIMKELDVTQHKDRDVHVAPCSAKSGKGLEEGFKLLIEYSKNHMANKANAGAGGAC